MAVTVNEYFEIEKNGIVYIPAMKITKDITTHNEEGVKVVEIKQVWETTTIEDITDSEVKEKALEIWTENNIATFKIARE